MFFPLIHFLGQPNFLYLILCSIVKLFCKDGGVFTKKFNSFRITTPNNNVKMNKRKQKETKINRTTMAVTKEIEVTTTDEQEQSLLS
jgi:hypothetical protein